MLEGIGGKRGGHRAVLEGIGGVLEGIGGHRVCWRV